MKSCSNGTYGLHGGPKGSALMDKTTCIHAIKNDYFKILILMKYKQGSTLALARLPGASKIPCWASKISKCSNLLAQLGK